MNDARSLALEDSIGYTFNRPELVRAALTHRSYEGEGRDYERLEFLGDAVVQLVVTEVLFMRYPEMPEGQMAKLRAAVVSLDVLADQSRRLELGPHIRMGKGEEQTGGRDKSSILSDIFEALVGAVFVDGGIEPARKLVLHSLESEIEARAASPGRRDYKTRLQELVAKKGGELTYTVTDTGPDHDKSFEATALVDGVDRGRGRGKSKKSAQQEAARLALAWFQGA